MPKMTDDQLRQAVEQSLEHAEGYHNDQLSMVREMALDYYYNRGNAAPHHEGRSSIQSSDVADMVEHIKSDILPALEGDTVVEVPPMGERDIDQARTETEALNHIVMCVNDGYIEMSQAIQNALLMRNGFLKVFLDTKEQVKVREPQRLDDYSYGLLMQNAVANLNNVDNGYTVKAGEPDELGQRQVRITEKSTTKKVCVKSIDPLYMSWQQDYDSVLLQRCNFIAERSYPTRGELIAMGYDKRKVKALKAGGDLTERQRLARNKQYSAVNWQGSEPSQDIIEFHECYIRIDADGDGLSELLKVCIADKTILEKTEVDWIPYTSGTPFIQPNRLDGLGVWDKLRYVQDAKTHFLRQAADNQNAANNMRVIAVDGQVRMDDLTNSRPGGVVRARTPDAVVPFPFNDVTGSAIGMLEYMDKVRSERAGAAIDIGSGEAQLAKETAHGVERTISAMEKMSAMMIRSMCESMIGPAYELVHKTARAFLDQPIMLKQQEQFVSVNPQDWPERDKFSVKAGLSLAERNRKRAALETVVLRQDALMQEGKSGIMVTDSQRHNAALDWIKCSGLAGAERYFTDPDSPQAQQAAQQAAMAAEQQNQFQQMLLELQQEVEQGNATREEAKILEDARQFDKELEFKYWQESQQQNMEEAKLTVETALEQIRERNGSDNNAEASAGADG